MIVHSFNEKLQFSLSKHVEGALDRIYQNYFFNVSDITRIERINNMNRQRAGIDTIVTLSSGEEIKTQEKWRKRKFTNDFLIEYCSVYQDHKCKKPGWIYTCDADYIFAVYEFSDLVKIYPVVQLKLAWTNNFETWIQKYRIPPAPNWEYDTLNVAVPCEILENEIRRVMRFDFQQRLVGVTA